MQIKVFTLMLKQSIKKGSLAQLLILYVDTKFLSIAECCYTRGHEMGHEITSKDINFVCKKSFLFLSSSQHRLHKNAGHALEILNHHPNLHKTTIVINC